ncbi:MAG: peptidylprolyl isomerase [Alphaproteobacteria bacterium]
MLSHIHMKRPITLLLLLLCALPSEGWAQRVDQLPGTAAPSPSLYMDNRIAAVVNDGVVSTSDIQERIKLIMLSSGLPDTPEVKQRLLVQVLRSLVDEQLQMQEAKRLDITVPKEEIDQALEKIARDNSIPTDMREFVASRGGSPAALEQQMRAGIAWSKVITRTLRPRVEIGDDEVDAVIERMRANVGKEEYQVSEILLIVDNPKDEDQVKQFADNLVQQLQGGANFAAIARQFSQGTGAAAGGDVGWIQEGQLAPELNQALTTLQTGQLAGPIRTSSGYHILGLREKRVISLGSNGDVKLSMQQVFKPFASDTEHEALLREGEKLKSEIASCTNLQSTVAEKFPGWRWNNLGEIELSKAPSDIASKVRDLSAGQSSQVLPTDKGALILFVCERKVPDTNVDRNTIVNSIGLEKLELQARRLLRDLRRSAYIDVRLGSNT